MNNFRYIEKYSLVMLLAACTLASCTKSFENMNKDKNAVAEIGPTELPFLFSKAISAVPINDQVSQNLYADQYAQYFANETQYFPTDRLTINMDWLQSPWTIQYTQVVPQLLTIIEQTDAGSVENAMAQVWWTYSFQRITDYFGPIPYFQAGKPGTSVPYDPQDQIYDDFFKRLTAAVEVLKNNTDKKPFGSADLLFNGDVNKWLKFANSLRLRMALRISKVDPDRAKNEAELAMQAGPVMTTSGSTTSWPGEGDDAIIQKSTQDYHPLALMSDWNEFRMSAAMESVLKGTNDPRMSIYFMPAVNSQTFEGLRNGLSLAQLNDPMNTFNANSHTGPRWASAALGGVEIPRATPTNVMSVAEVYFLRAEGALLGWNMQGTVQELYEAGIANSMKQWGINDETIIQNYVNSDKTPIAPDDFLQSPSVSTVPVKFDGNDTEIQFEQIALQKWIALFPDGAEAWADWRRSQTIDLYPVANSDNPDLPDPRIQHIRRLPFLLKEKQTNEAEVAKAIQLLNGPDNITTPLWWDKN